ncbi:hypothetical protein L195_g030017 [Trifolium pratense]|uniref:Uncharacterized protein n=1 Tax=Trifolium pratense TaxID=57577 RepID=A0A2K3L6E3_TRIPR|nr:hypothetical protein L195_g030017 [Trifolium pratense]
MGRKKTQKKVSQEEKTQKGNKKGETSSSRCTKESKEVKVEAVVVSSDSSSSEEIDEEYAEFLKTYNPQEFYPATSSSDGEDRVVETADPLLKAKGSLETLIKP